jgi:hypothetical protein
MPSQTKGEFFVGRLEVETEEVLEVETEEES